MSFHTQSRVHFYHLYSFFIIQGLLIEDTLGKIIFFLLSQIKSFIFHSLQYL
nr:MAG TPA: hypothetical protein [Caudoviricetes sp.]